MLVVLSRSSSGQDGGDWSATVPGVDLLSFFVDGCLFDSEKAETVAGAVVSGGHFDSRVVDYLVDDTLYLGLIKPMLLLVGRVDSKTVLL